MSWSFVVLGDTSSHGGSVSAATAGFTVDGVAVAAQGDNFECPLHGMVAIQAAGHGIRGNGKAPARNAYVARALVTLGVSAVGMAASLSFSGPLLRLIFRENSRVVIFVEALSTPRMAALILRSLGLGSLVTIGVSVLIAYLTPEEMEEWCWHSCLKDWKSDGFFKPFKDQQTELQKLYQALKEAN